VVVGVHSSAQLVCIQKQLAWSTRSISTLYASGAGHLASSFPHRHSELRRGTSFGSHFYLRLHTPTASMHDGSLMLASVLLTHASAFLWLAPRGGDAQMASVKRGLKAMEAEDDPIYRIRDLHAQQQRGLRDWEAQENPIGGISGVIVGLFDLSSETWAPSCTSWTPTLSVSKALNAFRRWHILIKHLVQPTSGVSSSAYVDFLSY
jgi:hypothetical protein